MPYIEFGGERIWVRTQGFGEDVLLIAGLGDDASSWNAQVQLLSRRFRVTTFDNRGAGRSSSPPAPWDVQDLALDALAVMDALQIRQAHVLGTSLGAAAAQEMAALAPGRVRTLVLNGTWLRSDPQFRDLMDSWIAAAYESDSVEELLSVVNLSIYSQENQADRLIYQWLDSPDPPHWQPYAAVCAGFAAAAEAAKRYDAKDRLSRIRAPTLLTVGSEDRVLTLEHTQAVADAIAEATVVVFRDCGHQPFQEHPQDFSRLVSDFFRTQGLDWASQAQETRMSSGQVAR